MPSGPHLVDRKQGVYIALQWLLPRQGSSVLMHDSARTETATLAVEPTKALPPASRKRWALIGAAASALIVIASAYVLWHIVREVDLWEVKAAFTSASARQLALAVVFTALSYILLTGYDVLALRQLKIRMPYRTTALASFTSYAVSFNLGFPLVTGGTVRYWIYAPRGLSASRIASLTVIAGITFWLGMGVVLGWSLIREAAAVAYLAVFATDFVRAAGFVPLGLVACYFIWVSLRHPTVKVKGWRLELPGPRLTVGQVLLGIGDVCSAAAVLFVLLPGGHNIGFETFLAIYVAGCMLGIASHSPGGLGVFEATMLVALNHLPREQVLGSLLLFRLIYYVAPFVLALALLGGYEALGRMRAISAVMRAGDGD